MPKKAKRPYRTVYYHAAGDRAPVRIGACKHEETAQRAGFFRIVCMEVQRCDVVDAATGAVISNVCRTKSGKVVTNYYGSAGG